MSDPTTPGPAASGFPPPGAPPGTAPAPPPAAAPAPAGRSNRSLLVAAAMAVVGLILLALGVVAYLGAGDDRDAADAAEAEAEEVSAEAEALEAEADDALAAAEELPALAEDLRAQVSALPTAFDETVAEINAVIDCIIASPGTIEGTRPCLADLQALEAAAAAELAQVDGLRTTLDEVRAALEAGNGADEEEDA